MSETKVKVPEGMLEAAMIASLEAGLAIGPSTELRVPIEAALRWLSENPIIPDDKTANKLWAVALELDPNRNENDHAAKNLVIEWQRRMFLAPEPEEPEVPEAIKDLISKFDKGAGDYDPLVRAMARGHNADLVEAYRRGQKVSSK